VRSLRQAIQNHNAGEALRLQGQLLVSVEATQKAVAHDDTDTGKALKGALADLQKGLDGNPVSLAAASDALDKLSGPTDKPANAGGGDAGGMATSLGSKIDAFRAAVSTNSRADMLRLQQDILTETQQDAATLMDDPSPEAAKVRGQLDMVRAGVSGDLDKLEGARNELSKVSGTADVTANGAAPAVGGATAAKGISDLGHFAQDLDQTVTAFQGALAKNDTATMLRTQRHLSDLSSQVDSGLKDAQSKPADEVRAAVASVRTAFAGDLTKLDEAHTHLHSVIGAAAPQGANPAAKPATGQPVGGDLQPIAQGLHDTVGALAVAVKDKQSPDEVNHKRDALKAEIAKAEAKLNGSTDSNADTVRAALGAAKEAAGGDDAKVAAAQSALEAALTGH
jgi:hypothetical protein